MAPFLNVFVTSCGLHILFLSYSATEKLVRAARQLVNRKKDDGFSALHLASLNGHRDVVEVLLTTVGLL